MSSEGPVSEAQGESGRSVPGEWDQVASLMGDFIEYWGFKNVHGRIWTHLYLSNEPLDALEIRQRLKISKALVSLSVHDLMHYNVIKEVGKSSRGTILYSANPNLCEAVFNVLESREHRLIARIQAACQLLQQKSQSEIKGISQERLQSLVSLVDYAKVSLGLFLGSKSVSENSLCQLLGMNGSEPIESVRRL